MSSGKKHSSNNKNAPDCKTWSHLKTSTAFDAGPTNIFGDFDLPDGSDVRGEPTTSTTGDLPRTFPSSMLILCLVERLCSLVEKDVNQSHKLSNLLLQHLQGVGLFDDFCQSPQFSDARQHFRQALFTLVKLAHHQVTGQVSSLQPVKRGFDHVDIGYTVNSSRSQTDFDVLGYISRGGFGKVYQVKNRLDGCKYALKKIIVRSQNELYKSILKEVMVLARLEHPNIVKYYTAWLEPLNVISKMEDFSSTYLNTPTVRIVEESSTEVSVSTSAGKQWSYTENSSKSQSFSKFEESSGSSFSIEFKEESKENRIAVLCSGDTDKKIHSSSSTQTAVEVDICGTWREQQAEQSKAGSSTRCALGSGKTIEPSVNSPNLSPRQGAVVPRRMRRNSAGGALLYIQMELCGRSLRQWLDFRPVEAEPQSMLGSLQLNTRLSCFWQLAAALEYLHKQGIVHHDIKPSNIFVFGNKRLKLGDFGLACSYEHSKGQVHHSWGTHTYAAPEQLQGGLCEFKSDIFSTGLVLLEMLMPPFHTNAERIDILSRLRIHGQVPSSIARQLPAWGELLRKMTKADPVLRPSAADLKLSVEQLLTFASREQRSKTLKTDSLAEFSQDLPERRTRTEHSAESHASEVFTSRHFSKSEADSSPAMAERSMDFSELREFSNLVSALKKSNLKNLNSVLDKLKKPISDPPSDATRIFELERQVLELKLKLAAKDHEFQVLSEQMRLLKLQLHH